MKFTAVFAVLAAATVVSAATNAERLARGLAPNAPGRRATPVARARRGSPSSTPSSQCNTGDVQCCQSVQSAGSSSSLDSLFGLLSITGVSPGTPVGVNCSPISAIGVGSGSSCTQQPVCCENNSFNGLVNIGCSPINIVL